MLECQHHYECLSHPCCFLSFVCLCVPSPKHTRILTTHPTHTRHTQTSSKQLEEAEGKSDAAQAVYASGLKRCPDCVALWRAAARLEEGQGNVGRARALLEQVTRGVGECEGGV